MRPRIDEKGILCMIFFDNSWCGRKVLERLRPLLFLMSLVIVMTGCSGKPPNDLGVAGGKLADCPSQPNCVSSMTDDSSRFVEPLSYKGDRGAAMARLEEIVKGMDGAKVVQRQPGYLRAEYRSSFFGFIDDVELYLPKGENTIHIRSASRLGYYDFGVNRKRVDKLRNLWYKRTKTAAGES